jgi:hypothetical protein
MSIDWRKNELEFETDEGTAKYINVGKIPYRRDKRVWGKARGRETWWAEGTEELFHSAECAKCGRRVFQCTSHPIRADSEVGMRIAHFVKTSSSEPPTIYCGDCVYRENPELLKVIAAGKKATEQRTEEDIYLDNLTAVFGGTR